MMGTIGDFVFGIAVLAIILYFVLSRPKEADITQLSEVKRWYARKYISKEELSGAISAEGKMTLKAYNALKSKVDRIKMLQTLTKED
jgi:hypothetical protein